MALAYLGIGANLGDRELNISEAIRRLGETRGITIRKTSSLLETDPVEYLDQPRFINQVVQITTTLAPEALLDQCLAVEAAMGRVRGVPKGPRLIDLDILLYDRIVMDTGALTLPHPRIKDREFVLIHLVELDNDLADPASGEKYSLILAKKRGSVSP